jgi:hypothetical protein
MTLLIRWERRRGWMYGARLLAGSSTLMLAFVLVISGTPLARAQTFTVLYNFSPYTGAWLYGTLVRVTSG